MSMLRSASRLAIVVYLSCTVTVFCVSTKNSARSSDAHRRNAIISSISSGDNGDSKFVIEDPKTSIHDENQDSIGLRGGVRGGTFSRRQLRRESLSGLEARNNIIGAEDKAVSIRGRRMQNEITSNHLIRLEFNGVTYASVSLSIVKANIVDSIEDVLDAHLGNGIEVINVARVYVRKLRIPSSRRLSYILLIVQISLRHPSWISSETTLDKTIEILKEYVDQDFRDYMRSLPGNGDYLGSVDVSEAYAGLSISVAATPTPIASPVLQKSTGSFRFKLVFVGVSPSNGDYRVLRNYIRYSVVEILNEQLESNVELLDMYMEPWAPIGIWLNFPMLIRLQFSTDRNYTSDHVYNILSRNIGKLDLHLDQFLSTTSISHTEKVELEAILENIFGKMTSVKIDKEDDPNPTQDDPNPPQDDPNPPQDDPNPTQAPTKSKRPVKPENDLLNINADDIEQIPWWVWVVIGAGSSILALCCCCGILQLMKRKGAANRSEPTTVTTAIYSSEPNTEQDKNRYGDCSNKVSMRQKSITARESETFAENRKTMAKKVTATQDNLAPQHQSKNFSQLHLYTHDPGTDLVLQKPKPSPPDPEGRMAEPKRKKNKKLKKRTNQVDP